jgi:hypothetical protein
LLFDEKFLFAVSRISMVARLCRFAYNGGIWDGVELLQAAMFADAPYREDEQDEFCSWLATSALRAAYELKQDS